MYRNECYKIYMNKEIVMKKLDDYLLFISP